MYKPHTIEQYKIQQFLDITMPLTPDKLRPMTS